MDHTTASPGLQIPGVELAEVVGHGGAGVVYRGRQVRLDREVAVKVVTAGAAGGDAEQRWQREISAMGRLSNHPNILAVFSGGVTESGAPYLVMPFVPGGTLHDRMVGDGPVPPAEVADIGAKLAGALMTAHEAGVLHRDVKPANVLLSPYGEPQLADFGIARLVDATATLSNTVHATVGYAAREVLSGDPASPASDVYSLGATLYACLTGVAPFGPRDGESLPALVTRAVSEDPPPLRDHGVPPALATVVERAMAKDLHDRWPDAAALQAALEDAKGRLGGDPREDPTVSAPQPGGSTTTVFATAVPVPDPDAEQTRTVPITRYEEPAPAPAPAPPPVADRRRTADGRRWWLVAVIAVAVLAAAFALLANDGDDGSDVATDDPAPVTVETDTATDIDTETDADEEPADTPASDATDAPSTNDADEAPAEASGPADAATTYVQLLADGDFDEAWNRTSPRFQASQDRDSWQSFWGGYDVEIVDEPRVQGNSGVVIVPLTFDGAREDYRMTLVEDDGEWLIDGPVGS